MKSLLKRFRTSKKPFKDFYSEWLTALKSTLLPLLRRTLSSSPSPDLLLLSTHVDLLHSHFSSYFAALDAAASSASSAVVLLFPEWRSPLEKPFLWLGDFHPYVFTNLLRSLLDAAGDCNSDEDEFSGDDGLVGSSWNAWRDADGSLRHKVEQVECGLRLMVPSVMARHREAQAAMAAELGAAWRRDGSGGAVGDVVGAAAEEVGRVFLDANRLRRSVLGDIVSALNVHQAALFLERVAQFYVGFGDANLLAKFKKSPLILD